MKTQKYTATLRFRNLKTASERIIEVEGLDGRLEDLLVDCIGIESWTKEDEKLKIENNMQEITKLPKIKLSELLNTYPNFDLEFNMSDVSKFVTTIETKTNGLLTPSKLIGTLLTLGLTLDDKGENTKLIKEIAEKLMS